MTHILRLDGIYKTYIPDEESKTVLENINLAIEENEFAALVGPSGCGKTTLLKIAAGFLQPEAGAVYKRGERIGSPGPDRLMVFQEFRQLFPWKTVLGNIIFALQAVDIGASRQEREQLARDYLQKVGLFAARDYYPHQLSGGMKQRAALARTLASDPEIMLMDEPFGSLDSETRGNLQELLLKIWREEKKTVLFVTHDIEEAVLLADRIIIMGRNPGRIKEVVTNNIARP
ncbi:MAG: ABC transporter ATP-binding protein, partial [Halanaerobiaceae bacterium]